MRIAILVKEFPPDIIGGTETQTLRMARELHRRTDHHVAVYTKAYPGPDPHDPAFELVRIPNWQVTSFISTLTFVLAAFLYLFRDRNQIDVLQCMMIYPNGFVGYLLKLVAGLPYFTWIRGGDYYFMKDVPIKRWMIRRVLSDGLVLTQTERIAEDVRSEFHAPSLEVLGNGVNMPSGTADGDKIIFVGTLIERKGVHVLIEAVEGTNVPLLIVGDGPQRERLESLASKNSVDAEFTGEVEPSSVPEYLYNGRLFVLPSIHGEGLPNVILEAMSVSLPVVATDTAGVADVVQQGKTGYVVKPGSTEELREKIVMLYQNSEECTRLGENAREYVREHHSWDVITAKLERIYEQTAQ